MGKKPTAATTDQDEVRVSGTPGRLVIVAGENGSARVGDRGVAVTGARGTASALMGGVAVGGDRSLATATKDCVALAGIGGQAAVGDGALARAASGGFATGELNSVAMVDDNAWAWSLQQGIALARIGLAETRQNGIAGAFAKPSTKDGAAGIAIAGPAGIALAFTEGVLVQAGTGGALVGYHRSPAGVQLVIRVVEKGGKHAPGVLYRFEAGEFVGLTATQEKQARAQIEAWKKPWKTEAARLRRKKR